MKNMTDLLRGFEFIEAIVSDVRSEIECTYNVRLNKTDFIKSSNRIYGKDLSQLGALNLSNRINRFLIETGKFRSINAHVIECELKHSMEVPSVAWSVRRWIVEVRSSDRNIFIDPLTSTLVRIFPDAPDVFIGEDIPDYLTPLEDVKVRGDNLLARLDKKLQLTIKAKPACGADWDGDVVYVFGISRFIYRLKYKIGLFEYLEYNIRGKLCDWLATKVFKNR